jgi:DNA-binding NtrC family response regulator
MDRKFDQLNIHQKIELLIADMIEKEVRFRDAMKEFQKIYIELAAKKYKGNRTKMAKALGLHRNTLHNRAKSLKIKKLPGG